MLIPFFAFCLIATVRQSAFVLTMDRELYTIAMNLSYPHRWITFWEAVTGFGDGWLVYPLLTLVLLRFLFKRHSLSDFGFVLLIVVAALSNTVLKYFFQLDRPVSLSPFTDLTTYTFPSGHAFNSVLMFYFMPQFLDLVFYKPGQKRLVPPLFAVIGIVMVGLSRVLLGAHWGSDVLGGWILGFAISNFLLMILKNKGGVCEEKI